MTLERKAWRVPEVDPQQVRALAAELGVSSITARILVNRGLQRPAEAVQFLSPSLADLPDPARMKDMARAVKRLAAARDRQEKIIIYGDYDVDGVTSCALLLRVLRSLGFDVDYYIPNRLDEGYGLNVEAVEHIAQRGVSLVLTVDCGITAVDEVGRANELGVDVIVTDHHQPGRTLPAATAVLNPNRPDASYPFSSLAGVGVAFKLAQALLDYYGLGDGTEYLDLVALGTIADVVPLIGENRVIAKYGLEKMASSDNPGLRALLSVTGLEGKELTAGHVGFVLGPRINAMGRIGDAKSGVELLTAATVDEALPLARQLDAHNRERQALEARVLEEALAAIKEDGLEEDRVLVVAREGWHHGVIGIVASRLLDRYHRPVIVIGLEADGSARGSCRSIEGFDIYRTLCDCADYLLSYGGHPMAAGITIEAGQIAAFRRQINALAAERLAPEDLIPKIRADAWVSLDSLNMELVEELGRLAPFGPGNPTPVLACRGVTLAEYRGVGKDAAHLKLRVCDERGCSVGGIAWRMAELLPSLPQYETVNIAFTPSINEWNGRRSLQLEVRDLQAPPASRYRQLVGSLQEQWEKRFSRWLAGVAAGRIPVPTVEEAAAGAGLVAVNDRRGCRDKLAEIGGLVKTDQPPLLIVRVNQPLTAVRLARALSSRIPGLSGRVGYWHGGLSDRDRQTLIDSVRAGFLPLVVWAGAEYPAIGQECEHELILYDLPETLGVATLPENCRLRRLHLLFGPADVPRTRQWIGRRYPERKDLVEVYGQLLSFWKRQGGKPFSLTDGIRALARKRKDQLWSVSVAAGMRVFCEIGLLQPVAEADGQKLQEEGTPGRSLYELIQPSGKLDLRSSISYNVGMTIRSNFAAQADQAMAGSFSLPGQLARAKSS